MKQTKLFAAISAAVVFSAAAFAETGHDVMEKFLNLPVPNYSQTTIMMDRISKDGKVEDTRTIMQYGKNSDDLVTTIFDFRTPADVKDTRFLQSEKKGKMADKWIYLPSLRTTRRIAATERSKSFMGCDFSYDDMSLRDIEDDTHEMMNENVSKTVGKSTYQCWQVKSTPVKKNDGGYAYRISFIDKGTYLPVFCEYYDKQGEHLKDWAVEEIKKTPSADGKSTYYIRWVNRMTNVQTGHSTLVYLAKQELDKVQPERLFTQNWLNTGK